MTTRKEEQEIEENLSEIENIFGDSDSSSDEEEEGENNNKQNSHTNNTNTTTATTKTADTNNVTDTIKKEKLSLGSRVNIVIEEDSGNVSYSEPIRPTPASLKVSVKRLALFKISLKRTDWCSLFRCSDFSQLIEFDLNGDRNN